MALVTSGHHLTRFLKCFRRAHIETNLESRCIFAQVSAGKQSQNADPHDFHQFKKE
jgi:hypothetical protein